MNGANSRNNVYDNQDHLLTFYKQTNPIIKEGFQQNPSDPFGSHTDEAALLIEDNYSNHYSKFEWPNTMNCQQELQPMNHYGSQMGFREFEYAMLNPQTHINEAPINYQQEENDFSEFILDEPESADQQQQGESEAGATQEEEYHYDNQPYFGESGSISGYINSSQSSLIHDHPRMLHQDFNTPNSLPYGASLESLPFSSPQDLSHVLNFSDQYRNQFGYTHPSEFLMNAHFAPAAGPCNYQGSMDSLELMDPTQSFDGSPKRIMLRAPAQPTNIVPTGKLDRKSLKRLRNRVSASRCRIKKKVWIKDMEVRSNDLLGLRNAYSDRIKMLSDAINYCRVVYSSCLDDCNKQA